MTFNDFVAARLVALLRYATVISCDPHLAEDIVQEVLLRVQQRWSRMTRLEQPEAYVKRMVLNEFLAWRRRRVAREVPLSLGRLDRISSAAADPAAAVDERDELVRLIAALPPRQRAVLALRYFEGLTDAEIASQSRGRPPVRSGRPGRLTGECSALDPCRPPPDGGRSTAWSRARPRLGRPPLGGGHFEGEQVDRQLLLVQPDHARSSSRT